MAARIFVSYKSEDCNAVRAVVEILTCAGLSFWFAEYEVVPSNYDTFDQELTRNLEEAVRSCDSALAFTNDRWARSDYCSMEMTAILQAGLGDSVIEVRMPPEDVPHLKYPILQRSPGVDDQGDAAATAAAVLDGLGLGRAPVSQIPMPPAGPPLQLSRFGLSLIPGPFEVSIQQSRHHTLLHSHGAPVVVLQAELLGHPVQLVIVVSVYDSVLQSLQVAQDGAACDRDVYTSYRRYARKWEQDRRHSMQIRGLHIVFWQSHSQLALTYVTPASEPGTGQDFWERRYVLSPRGNMPGERGEIHLIFSAPSVKGDLEQQFRTFVGLCPHFDRLIQTVQYRPTAASGDIVNSAPTVVVRLLYLALGGWGIHALTSMPIAPVGAVVVATVSGTILADLVLVLYSSVYRQALWTIETAPIDDSLGDAYSRMTNQLPLEMVGYPVVWAMQYVVDLVVALGGSGGTLKFPGPSVVWLILLGYLLIRYTGSSLGVGQGIALGLLLGFAVGLIVVLRFVGRRTHVVNWGKLKLR